MSTQDQTLTYATREEDGCQIIALDGSLCDDGIALARAALSEAVGAGGTRVAVEMNGVDYVSSSGIGMLVSILKKCHQSGIQFALCGLTSDIHELFSLTRLDQVFSIARDFPTWKQSWA